MKSRNKKSEVNVAGELRDQYHHAIDIMPTITPMGSDEGDVKKEALKFSAA